MDRSSAPVVFPVERPGPFFVLDILTEGGGTIEQGSRLLIDEPPRQVLPSLAVEIGLNNAIVLQQLHYWVTKSQHEYLDQYGTARCWVFNTLNDWHEQFPFWSKRTIRRIFDDLEEKGLILRDNFNRNKSDRTRWYTIRYEALEEAESDPPAAPESDPDQLEFVSPEAEQMFRELSG